MGRTVFALLGLLTACAVPAPPPVSLEYRLQMDTCSEGTPGTPPGTVHVVTSTGQCTGVVISPTEVLTAGHCLDRAEWAFVDFGDGVVTFVEYAAVNGPFGEDIALMDAVVPAGAPIVAVGAPPAPGGGVTFAGYGCNKTGATRRATPRIREIADVHANPYTGCACKGDSGGPVFDAHGAVVGVMTHTNLIDRTWVTETTVLPYLRGLLAWIKATSPARTDP